MPGACKATLQEKESRNSISPGRSSRTQGALAITRGVAFIFAGACWPIRAAGGSQWRCGLIPGRSASAAEHRPRVEILAVRNARRWRPMASSKARLPMPRRGRHCEWTGQCTSEGQCRLGSCLGAWIVARDSLRCGGTIRRNGGFRKTARRRSRRPLNSKQDAMPEMAVATEVLHRSDVYNAIS